MRPVTEAIEEIQATQRSAFDKLSGAAQQLEMQHNRHLREAMTLGLIESELTLADGQRLTAGTLAALADVYSKCALPKPDISEPRTVDDLEGVGRKVQEAIRECSPTKACCQAVLGSHCVEWALRTGHSRQLEVTLDVPAEGLRHCLRRPALKGGVHRAVLKADQEADDNDGDPR